MEHNNKLNDVIYKIEGSSSKKLKKMLNENLDFGKYKKEEIEEYIKIINPKDIEDIIGKKLYFLIKRLSHKIKMKALYFLFLVGKI